MAQPMAPNPQPNTPPLPSDAQMLSAMQGSGGAQSAQPEPQPQSPSTPNTSNSPSNISDSDMLAAMQRAAQPPAQNARPSQIASAVGTLAPMVGGMGANLLGALFQATKGASDAPGAAATGASFGKSPEAQQKIFQNLAGPGYESRIMDGKVEFRQAGSQSAWSPVQKDWFSSVHSFIQRTLDLLPDAFEGSVMAATQAGMTALGAGQGTAAGPAGTVLGGIGAAAGSGAVSAATAALAREGAARLLGADEDPNLAANVAIQAGVGGALGAGAGLIKRAAQWGAEKLNGFVESSQAMKTTKVGDVVNQFAKIFQDVVGKPFPQNYAERQALMSTHAAGETASDAVAQSMEAKEAAVGRVWDSLIPSNEEAAFATPNHGQALEQELKSAGWSWEVAPKELPSDPDVWQMKPPATGSVAGRVSAAASPELRAFHQQLAGIAEDMRNGGGMGLQDIRDTLNIYREGAGYGKAYADLTPIEKSMRGLRSGLMQDRDLLLPTLAQGTPVEGTAVSAFKNYANNIDDLRATAKAAMQSPEKFVKWMFQDAQHTQLAKDVLTDNDAIQKGGVDAWSSLKSAWFRDNMQSALDPETNIVNVMKLHDSLNKNPEIARIVVGADNMAKLQNLGLALNRIGGWKELLKSPDSSQAQAIWRAASKVIMSGGSPYHAANMAAELVGYNKSMLQAINQHGIQGAMGEATTAIEQDWRNRLSQCISRLANIGTLNPELPKGAEGIGQTVAGSVPVASWAIPGLLAGAVRPASEPPAQQVQARRSSWQDYVDQQEYRARITQQEIEEAKAQAAQIPGNQKYAFPKYGPGQPPDFSKSMSIFQPRHGGLKH